MSKRDDDSQADLEVGMTTAERRRRRRRGAGLRVPSDNVPRRSSPPVVAPVPEDPSLAMSIAYSFTSDASEPVPAPINDGMDYSEPAVIDPVSGSIEQADFEMKTREMSAVDLEALGLSETLGGSAGAGASAGADGAPERELPGLQGRHWRPERALRVETRPDSSEELDVDVDVAVADVEEPTSVSAPPQSPESAYRSRERLKTVALSDEDLEEVAEVVRSMEPERAEKAAKAALPSLPGTGVAHGPSPQPASGVVAHGPSPQPASGVVAHGPSAQPASGVVASPMPHTPSGALRMAPTTIPPLPPPPAASTQIPLSPPGPASTASGQILVPAAAAQSGAHSLPSMRPPPTPPQGSAAVSRPNTPTPPPPMSPAREIRDTRSAASEMWGEDTPVPVPAPPQASASPPRPAPEPVRAEEPPRPEAPVPAAARVDAASSVPELDLQDLERAESSGEFEVDVDADADAEEIQAQEEPRRARTMSTPPPMAPVAASPGPAQPAATPQVGPGAGPGAGQGAGPGAGQGTAPVAASAGATGPAAKDPHAHAHPPPPPAAALHHHTKAPPAPPQPAKKDGAAKPAAPAAAPAASSAAAAPARAAAADTRPRGKPWFVEVFDEDYLRTLPFLTPQATQAEAEFAADAMGLTPGAQVLDIGCGYGRHAMELAARGFHVVGLDLSTPLLLRGGEEAQRRGLQINFVRGDMRELDFDAQFDGAYCLFSTFGYFDDETNKRTAANIARALKPGGRVLLEILNRDYVIADLPTRVWWEGDGCVVLEEVELNYFSSRIQVNRSVVFDDGRQVEQEISIRAYSLHEVGKLMHAAGFRVLEVSGGYQTRGRFFGNQSRHIIVLAERKDPAAP